MALRAGLVGLGMMGKNHARYVVNRSSDLSVLLIQLVTQTGTIDKSLIVSSVDELIERILI